MSETPPIPLCEPYLRGNAGAYLGECLATNYVSSIGPFVERFEREFAAHVGARFAVACASGTAALHTAFRLLGIEKGDEVFVSTLTFIASANPVLYEGATPVLVDSEMSSWNMDAGRVIEEIEARIRSRRKLPKAIEPVHVLGHPAALDRLVELCDRHGIVLIEDAAEALGARYREGPFRGRHVGTVGRLGCFSFNGNKIITTGGGGMIATDDESLARRARHLTTQAKLPGVEYDHDEVGYNYRLSNLAAAVGVAQLEILPECLARKREIAARYQKAFSGVEGLSLPPACSWADPTFWLYSVLIDPDTFGLDRTALFERLRAQRIQSRPLWKPLHTMAVYRDSPRLGGAVAEGLFARGLSLPCSVGLTDLDQDRVIDAVLSHRQRGR
jgi:dTDP-4-amino-4,6-dideoxygalactose transaminase